MTLMAKYDVCNRLNIYCRLSSLLRLSQVTTSCLQLLPMWAFWREKKKFEAVT